MSAIIESISYGDLYDQLTRRLTQARGIADIIGNLEGSGDTDDESLGGACWAIVDLIDQVREIAERLEKLHHYPEKQEAAQLVQ